jgi:hypothetical protein
MTPNKPLYFYTNAGAMLASDNNRTFTTASEAYHYYVAEKYFLLHPTTILQKVASKSALFSLLYAYSSCDGMRNNKYNKSIAEMTFTKNTSIKLLSTAKANHSKLHIVSYP